MLRNLRLVIFTAVCATTLVAQEQRAILDAPFDKPSKTAVINHGQSPYYTASQHVRNKLTCYSYSNFMVKEYDQGQKGAEWLSVVPVAPNSIPPCTLSRSKGERVIEGSEWSGYFRGAKGRFAFFVDADGYNGGWPFFVYDTKTGRKIFEDSVAISAEPDAAFTSQFHISVGTNHQIALRYFRVVTADCDLTSERTGCWNRIRAKYDITESTVPVCRGYEHADGKWDSALAYPVNVYLSERPQIATAKGPLFCWPVD